MMDRQHASCRFRLPVAVLAKLEVPDAGGTLDVRCFQLRNLFESAAGERANQRAPRKRRLCRLLGWRDLKFGVGEQCREPLVRERLVMNGRRFDQLAIEWIDGRPLAANGAPKD